MTRRTNLEILEEALAHCEIALSYVDHDLSQQIVIDAASMRLSAGIDALSRLDEETRQRVFGPGWRAMWGMRNRIAHGYFRVDDGLIRDTLEVDLPGMLTVIRAEIESETSGG